jgi:hypothetical protein
MTEQVSAAPEPDPPSKSRHWWERRFTGRLAATLQAEGQGLPYLGFRIFKWLIALTVFMLLLLVIYGWNTYPNRSDYFPKSSTGPTDPWKAYQDARESWVTQIKDLGQLFVLTPLFPLMGAVIGYIFGKANPEKRDPAKNP